MDPDEKVSSSDAAAPVPPALPSPTKSLRSEDEDAMSRVFKFLSTATPEVLAGVGVGLAAVTYFVLGKLGLLLIGAFGGVVAFISWEARNPDVARAVRGERGVDALARILDLKEDGRDKTTPDLDLDEVERVLAQSFDEFRPETREALNNLVDAIIRDYVKWWYSPIVPSDKSFPMSCRKVLTAFLLSVSNQLSRKRPADSFLDFLTNSSSIVIVFFSELSAAFTGLPAESKASATDTVYNYLASNPDSSLSNLLSQKQQASKFREVAEHLLGFLERPTHNCDPARVFLREIIAGVILEMTLQTCSKAEWINSWIVYLLEDGEPDLSQAIDVGMGSRPEAAVDLDDNSGTNSVPKPSRSSQEVERARIKESKGHKQQLSKAEEEMEEAMEEMKRMNQMIAEEEEKRTKDSKSAAEAEQRLAGAMKRNADELEIQSSPRQQTNIGAALPSPSSSDNASPKRISGSTDEHNAQQTGKFETPLTPRSSTAGSSGRSPSPKNIAAAQFTSFDQIVPPGQDESEAPDAEATKPPPLTLHNATITIHDEPVNEKGRIKSKPTWDYLVQVEPANSLYPGWMTVKRYSDFEKLHEVLGRIAKISGAAAFTEQHSNLPSWKAHTRTSLRGELERYLRDACWWQALADTDGMKRFLERDFGQIPSSKSGFQAFETMGKNMLDVLASAPKGVADGGKIVVGGVTGVLGNMGLGQRKSTSSSLPTTNSAPLQDVTSYTNRLSISTPSRMDSGLSSAASRRSRDSMDSQRSSVVSSQPPKVAPMERRASYQVQGEAEVDGLHPVRTDRWEYAAISARGSQQNSRASSIAPPRSPSVTSLSGLKLPPPPEEMPDDYDSPAVPNSRHSMHEGMLSRQNSLNGASPRPRSLTRPESTQKPPMQGTRTFSKLSEQETRVAVELLFAVINELYTLSSIWSIRRTVLQAAKSFLLRPGNPSLISIQELIQGAVLDANTSDAGIATHLRKLRENTMPTEEELAGWPAESSAEEKEKLRIKARKLLIQSGVPAALMGVMGQNATTEAMGRIFDCLQIEEVARGLFFGIMLQAVRVITQ
jgi:hypothetical protein